MEKGRRWGRVFRTACNKWLHRYRPPALPAGEGWKGEASLTQSEGIQRTRVICSKPWRLHGRGQVASGKAGFISLWEGNKSRALGALGVSPGLPQDGLRVQLGCPLPAWLPA